MKADFSAIRIAALPVLMGVVLVLSLPSLAYGWMYPYGYRKPIVIGSAAGAGIDYQVKVVIGESSAAATWDVHLEGRGLNFPNDIRFRNADDDTELAHWLESTTGSSPNRVATFWVKVADDLGSDRTIQLYYGADGDASASDGNATFIFFDDFNDGVVDTTKWTKGGTMTEAGGIVAGSSSQVYDGDPHDYLFGKTQIPINTLTRILMRNHAHGASAKNSARPGVLAAHGNPYYKDGFGWQDYDADGNRYTDSRWTTTEQKSRGTFAANQWYTLDAIWQSGSNTFIVDEGDRWTHTNVPPADAALYTQVEGDADYDLTYTRKYVTSGYDEPAFASADAEEAVPPFPKGWRHRVSLTIDKTFIHAHLTDWTLVFDQTFGAVLTSAHGPLDVNGTKPARGDGGDIRFSSDKEGLTLLPCDIRDWSTNAIPANATCEIAVKVPNVATDENTVIYMWWGNAEAVQPAVGAALGQYSAYDDHFIFVSGDGGGSERTAGMATTRFGTTSVSGKLGSARSFNGSSEYVRVPYFAPPGTLTISALFRPADTDQKDLLAWGGINVGTDHYQGFRLDPSHFLLYGKYGGSWNPVADTVSLAAEQWRHGAVTDDSGSVIIFRDGNSVATGTSSASPALSALAIGAVVQEEVSLYWNGLIDEIRVSNVARSAAWIAAESANVQEESFLAFGDIRSTSASGTIFLLR